MADDRLHAASSMNRRHLLMAGAAFGFSGSGLLSMSNAKAQGTPKRGGTMTLQITGDPPNFDMFSNTSSYPLNVIGACYNSLVMYDPSDPQKIVGDLAESWTTSEDGRQYTFTLRKGVKFHDGARFTSADVKATFDFVKDPPAGQLSTRKSLLSAVKQIVALDDDTVRFELDRASPSLLANLAIGWMVIAPKHVLEAKGNMKKDVIGTGPFRFKSYQAGNVIDLERNPDYHVPGRPYLDGMKIYIVPEPSTIMALMRGGRLDYWDGIGARDAKNIENQFANVVQVLVSPAPTACNTLDINVRRKPFDDIRVRKAMALAIAHKQAVAIGADVGATDLGGLMAPGSEWALPDGELAKVAGYGPDVEGNRNEARKLLAEAGYPSGFTTTVLYRNPGPEVSQVTAVLAADQFKQIGINATIVSKESGLFFDAVLKGGFDLVANSISALTIDPDFVLGQSFTCNGASNNTGLCDARIDGLYERQSSELDPKQRIKLVNELDRAILEQYAAIPVFHRRKRIALGRRIQNLIAHPEPDNNRRMQDVWIA